MGDHVSLNASDRFLDATEKAFEQLAEIPGIGVLRDFGNPEYEGMRMYSIPQFKKYLIFYRMVEEKVEVLRVLHGARDVENLFTAEEEE